MSQNKQKFRAAAWERSFPAYAYLLMTVELKCCVSLKVETISDAHTFIPSCLFSAFV